jgi:hypothetical protein
MDKLTQVFEDFDDACYHRRWDEALRLGRLLADEYHMICGAAWDLKAVLRHIKPWVVSSWEDAALVGNSSSCFLVGYYHHKNGRRDVAKHYFSIAAEQGHVLAHYYSGECDRAIDLGCPRAMDHMAKHSAKREDRLMWTVRAAYYGSSVSFNHLRDFDQDDPAWKPATLWYLRACAVAPHPRAFDVVEGTDITSLGIWEPERNCHHMLPMQVRTEIMQWLLVSYRMNLIRDLRLLICAFIATE